MLLGVKGPASSCIQSLPYRFSLFFDLHLRYYTLLEENPLNFLFSGAAQRHQYRARASYNEKFWSRIPGQRVFKRHLKTFSAHAPWADPWHVQLHPTAPWKAAAGLQAALHCLDPPATHLNLDAQASISFQQLLQMLVRRQTNVPFPMLFFLSMKGSVKCYAKQ